MCECISGHPWLGGGDASAALHILELGSVSWQKSRSSGKGRDELASEEMLCSIELVVWPTV